MFIHNMLGWELDNFDNIARDYLTIDHSTKVIRIWDRIPVFTNVLLLEAVQVFLANPE